MVKKLFTLISFLFLFILILFKVIPTFSIHDSNEKNIEVEVRGDVKQEKKLTLKLGSTFSELINQIELTDTSDISDYALNLPLSNNMVINIRSKTDNNLISINSASLEELCTLPGIGEKTAFKIIEYRENNGSFHYLEELMNVSGIGVKKYEKIKEHITL